MNTTPLFCLLATLMGAGSPLTAESFPSTRLALREGRWLINGEPTNPGSPADGLLMNVRMVNAVLEDRNKPEFDPESNTDRFGARIPDYAKQGVNAFTICPQGGMPGYEGTLNSAFESDGSLRPAHLALKEHNHTVPFHFDGAADDPVFYTELARLTGRRGQQAAEAAAPDYFPPPESQGGWRKLEKPDDVRRLTHMDPVKLHELREWLLQSDNRNFAAVVIRRGYIVLEVERGNSARTDARRVASVSKAVCATVLAIASERSQQEMTPRKMTFADPAFDLIPWAQPLSDPRKAQITVQQLFNHTSGICPEATGAPNDGSWEYILGHSDDVRTARLAFDPGTGCGYSTHALAHAALVCETVTGMPYDLFAIEALFQPLGIESWWFQYYDGGDNIGRHPSHGLGMPARDLARIAYCMRHDGQWRGQQVIPKWFVSETATPTHHVTTPEMRWKLNPQVFSHGWELPARHQRESGRSGEGIPSDARSKPGSGGQLIAFVPSLDLVIARQTGSSGDWAYEECLRRACAAVLP
jgi:CubicO group peptidase (beta-lactamase class C family)